MGGASGRTQFVLWTVFESFLKYTVSKEAAKMTQHDVAEEVGYNPRYVNSVFSAKKPAGRKLAEKLAGLLECQPEIFMWGSSRDRQRALRIASAKRAR